MSTQPSGQMYVVTYRTVRFFRDERPREVVDTGLTEAQAKAVCSSDATKGEGWFLGYEKETS